ncbi:MAG: hypothetical protein JW816_04335 [Candidatus Buchananbacteria bacterium]|nr:hypothetical protein [Candidatus Buchananbacteria bacterium]
MTSDEIKNPKPKFSEKRSASSGKFSYDKKIIDETLDIIRKNRELKEKSINGDSGK